MDEKKQYEIKVYKIWYPDAPEDIYVGSTKLTLAQRMVQHRQNARRGKTSLIYTTMRAKGVNTFQYVMLGSCMVSNVEQQRMFEQTYIANLKPTLNTYRAYATEEEHKQNHKEDQQKPERKQARKIYNNKPEVKQKARQYNQRPEIQQRLKELNQKPEIKQYKREWQRSHTRTCICGSNYVDTPSKATRHLNTDYHIEFVEGLQWTN